MIAISGENMGHIWMSPYLERTNFRGGGNHGQYINISRCNLYEDENALLLRNSDAWKVGRFGRGRFTFYEGKLYFSSSDNSSVFENGRRYVFEFAESEEPHQEIVFPNDIAIEITNICNARCIYCPLYQNNENALKAPKGYMDMELFKKIVDEIALWPVYFSIYLNNGGEPLIDRYFTERILYLKQKGLSERIILQTNAEFLTVEKAKLLLDAGISYIFPAFDGATKDVYEKHRLNCNYDKVLENIKTFARLRDEGDYGTSIQIKFMRTKWNEHELVDAYNMFNEFLSPELDHFQEEYSHTWNEENLKSKGFALTVINSRKVIRECRMVNTYLAIYQNGDIGTCCLDYNHEVFGRPLGNVKDKNILSIWTGEDFAKIRHSMKSLFKFPLKNETVQRLFGLPAKCRDCYLMYFQEDNIDNLIPHERLYCKAGFSSYIYKFQKPNL